MPFRWLVRSLSLVEGGFERKMREDGEGVPPSSPIPHLISSAAFGHFLARTRKAYSKGGRRRPGAGRSAAIIPAPSFAIARLQEHNKP